MFDDSRLVNERFFSVALRFGAHPALAFRNAAKWGEWTYQELADRACGLASYLKDLGVRPGDAVGIIASRYPDTIAAMIAILDLGAHYIPLDPGYPEPRLRLLCDDAGVKQILSAAPLGDRQRFPPTVHTINGVDLSHASARDPTADRSQISAETPAYIMFTSGSMGEPKGVVVPHRAIVRLIDNPNFMRLDSSRVFLYLAPLGFDASTLEIWGPLLNGGKCVLYPDQQLPTASGLKAVIDTTGVNSMWLTASLFNSILDQDARSLAGVDELLTGGEALSVPHICKALAELKGTQLINGYGPTENTTFTVCYRIPADFSDAERRVPIGVPISGTKVAIVDEQLRPVPAGVEGELVAMGEGLALGYLNKPALTRERFIEIAGTNGASTRGYRTGDRVVQRDDGLIDFLGRFDDQVKIDGYRIEPGETEHVIAALPGIKECRVLVRSGPAGQKRLAAYVVATDSARQQNLRNRLSEVLPAFMVPHYLFFLDALPTNANGKLDKAALPDPFERTAAMPMGNPSPEFAAVGGAWEEIMGRRPSSEDLNFFDAGGTSLEAVRLHELLSERFKRELAPTFVFEYTTIKRQAKALGSLEGGDEHAGERGQTRSNAIARGARRRRLMSADSGPIDLPEGALAVVGLVGRFPGARNVDELWENLCSGREGVRFFEPEELDPTIPVSLRSNPTYVRAKGVVEDCDKFDAGFFGITPLEAQVMDPQQRIMLELAWSALENAGHSPSQFPGTIGVYAGMNWNRYRATCVSAHPEIVARFGEFNTAIANETDFLATRLSYKLNLRGPSVTVSTACSTSLVALAQASQALLDHECDLALAGGVSISVPVNAGYLYQEDGMLSADGHCRAFDASSSGTTFNDGAGFVVLRRLKDAIEDADHIYAVVRGFAVNNDGSDKVSFTAPSVSGQAAVIRSALERADVDPATIGLIEAHGTATPLGDPIEVAALKRVFAGAKSKGARCALGSVKSSIGHLIHAAGVAGFIKAVLAVYYGKIPPSLFFEAPNPRLGLEESPFYVNTGLEDWVTSDYPRRAGVSSFGFGGTNAHVIVEQPPAMAETPPSGLPRVLCLSAKTEDGLTRQTDALKHYFAAHGNSLPLDAVAYTLQSGREPMPYRAGWAVRSAADARSAFDDKRRAVRGRSATSKGTAFMFTGQGAQRARMGQWLYENNAFFRRCLDDGAERLKARTGFDVRLPLFSASEHAEHEVDQTRVAQPALFLLEYSLARTLESMGVTPGILLGHSIGEFVAAALAGIFTYEDALYVVAKRGEAMQGMPPGGMLVVYCDELRARSLLSADVSIAAVNAPELCTLAGPDAAIDALAAELDSRGLRNKRLRTSHAFHSSMMDPAVAALRSVLGEVALSAPRRAVISTVTGRRLSGEEATNPEYWARQLRETVRFAAALDCLAEEGEFVLLEVGPGGTLATLALQHPRADRWAAHAVLPGCGLGEGADVEVLSAVAHCWVHGASVDWRKQWNGANPRRLALPTYPFARTRYWLDPPQQHGAAGTGGPWLASVPEPPSSLDVTTMNDSNRLDRLERRVIKVLEDTSGHDLSNADREISFSELGFDSLLLTQVSTALKQAFTVEVTFRALLEDCTSIRELTEHLTKILPAEAVIPAGPVAQLEMSMPTIAPAGLPLDPQSVPANIKLLIEQQLALMQMQLQVLGAVRGAAPAQPGDATPGAGAPATASPAGMASDGPPEGTTEGRTPKKHTPGTRIEKSRAGVRQLTRAQQAYIDKLIDEYTKRTARSKAFTQRHRKHLADPRTVSGFNPLWKEMVYPIVTNRSKGSKIWDLDGREYIDLTNGFGPIFFGHSPDFVTDAVLRQIAEGVETGPQSPLAGEVAELFCELTGHERVAYANTGSEAVLAALRLARAVTGREKVVIFDGAYHGIFDEVVVRPGKNGAGLPAASGIPRSHTSNMIVLPYGTDESLERIRGMVGELAAVMVESVQSRRPGVQPVGFLKQLREITEQAGTALIFDEAVTGFRVHPGGVQAQFDIRADLAVYGKVVAGGYPIGLVGGKARFMDALDGGFWQFGDESIPEVGVTFFAGTFVRHPLALAATKAVLERMKAEGPALQSRLAERTADLARELKAFLKEIDSRISFEEFSSFFYVSVAPEEQYGSLLFYLLRLYGIHAWEFRPCFLTTSHTDEDIAAFKTAFVKAVSALVQHGLLQGDAVAVERLNKARSSAPPVEGARLGKDKNGAPAWFVPDPERPGKYVQVGDRRVS